MKVEGQCLCGDLTYSANVNEDTVGVCSCSDCQTLSGSAFRVTVFVEDGSFTLLTGEPSIYVKVAESGRRRELGFCPGCGTSIFSRPPEGESGYFGLRVGGLRQRDALVPKARYWQRSAQRWIEHIGELPAFDEE
jgi:hypothetical protein